MRLLAAAEDGQRVGSVLDILVVEALAHHAAGRLDGGSSRRSHAPIDLAEPEGYVRLFVDEGRADGHPAEARRAGDQMRSGLCPSAPRGHGSTAGSPAAVDQPLIEPLSERELDVLRLLESDLAGPDIARELSVSLPTVRTHTQNIYAKLGVTNRRAAVRRATELGLLSPARSAGLGSQSRSGDAGAVVRARTIAPLITCGDARSSHPPPRCVQ